jgi:hypothetical protein
LFPLFAKFATGVYETGDNFGAGIEVLLTPVANLPFATGINNTSGTDTGGAP